MDLLRVAKHLFTSRRQVGRRFPPSLLDAVETAIRQAEALHRGEICFVIEAGLGPRHLLRGMTPRERALDVFATLRVWDTQDNSGVLIYVLLADRAIEIVADRGIHARSGEQAWGRIAAEMRDAFAAGDFARGALGGVALVAAELLAHVPSTGADELPNEVSLL